MSSGCICLSTLHQNIATIEMEILMEVNTPINILAQLLAFIKAPDGIQAF